MTGKDNLYKKKGEYMTEMEWKGLFQQIEENFGQAVVSNSVEAMKRCTTTDWVLVDSQGGIIPQERFFQVVEQGLLSHSSMSKEVLRAKAYGDVALVTSRGKNTAHWQGQEIEADEWVTDVYKKENGKWLCVLTHLTPVHKS